MSQTRTSPGGTTGAPESSSHSAILWVHPEARLTPLRPGTTLIGRAEDAVIQLTGSQVSRRHATISLGDSRLVLRDEGSLNKARCNGLSLPECRLSDNDVVRVGDWVGVILQGNAPLADSDPGLPFREDEYGAFSGPRSRAALVPLARAARSSLSVVIQGQTGCGKEVAARAIHAASGRSGPLVAVNCAAQPDHLFEAQFFGHTRGAFTGASVAAPGYFGAANGGTLFLDELLELSLAQQAKLLRVVEEGRVTPVGATQSSPIDVRVVCASQQSLSSAVEAGRFRADLHARLSGVTLQLLPLAQRREEIVPLFSWFMQRASGAAPKLSAGFAERLCLHAWPLNVRELLAAAKRAHALWPAGELLNSSHVASLLGAELAPQSARAQRSPSVVPAPVERGVATDALELGKRTASWFDRNQHQLRALREALQATDGNVSEAARRVGISRQRALRLLDVAERLSKE